MQMTKVTKCQFSRSEIAWNLDGGLEQRFRSIRREPDGFLCTTDLSCSTKMVYWVCLGNREKCHGWNKTLPVPLELCPWFFWNYCVVSCSLFQEGREPTVFVSVVHVRDVEKNKWGCMLQNLQRLILKIAITACMQYVGPRKFTRAVCFAKSL